MGRLPKNHKKTWTPEEIEDLLDLYGTVSMASLMKRFNRSEGAIKQKYLSLEGVQDMFIASGDLSVGDVAYAIGVDRRTIHHWITHFGLQTTQRYKTRGSEGRHRMFIHAGSFWRWAAKNKGRIPFHKLKRGIILPEPPWVETEVKQALRQFNKKENVNWTTEEDESAFFWWQSGMNYREIAKRLGRPEKGTQRRLTIVKKRKGVAHVKTN